MNEQIRIETPRLCLHPFDERFLTDRYVAWLNDPEVVRYSEQRHYSHTIESCRNFVASCDGKIRMLWAIEKTENGQGHVGNIDASIDYMNGVADISILIGARSVWGTGIGCEAFQAVMSFMFEQIGIRKVTAGTMVCNHGMRAIMRRVGMKEEAIRKGHYMIDKEPVDLVYGAIFKESQGAD